MQQLIHPPLQHIDTQFILLPMEMLLTNSVHVEQYDLSFVKEIFEMSFYVLNRLSNPYSHRVGINYTLQSAVDQEIFDYMTSEPELGGYLSQNDQQIIDAIISEGYHYLIFLLDRLGIAIDQENVELTPDVWINTNLLIRVTRI